VTHRCQLGAHRILNRQFDLESALLTTMQRLPDAGASGN
jgi:hypothetical protein